MELLNQVFGDKPSVITDPFHKECINYIYMSGNPNYWKHDGSWEFKGSVKFQRGNTNGEQKFTANNFSELFQMIYEFCNSL